MANRRKSGESGVKLIYVLNKIKRQTIISNYMASVGPYFGQEWVERIVGNKNMDIR